MVNSGAAPNVALRQDELERISQQLGREPTIVELHAFDAQWSEHCSYKSSRHHLKKLPTTGPDVILGPGEDSGILRLGEHAGETYGVVVAHESHNHPSQVVPFEGAATGIGGIVRDVLCMGAEVIAVADPLRFGRVENPHSHQRSVAVGVVEGIGAYGNAIGVPNIAGDAFFDETFDENCLVNVVALGVVKASEIVHSYAPKGADGWDIVLVGKATDPSGFGGASFSSLTLDSGDEDANKGAVQVPDPFLKNVLMRATYRVFALLRERRIEAGFKDLGAGGIMGCSAEIASSGGFGADLNLDEVNVAVEGMPPEVVAVGETQERLLWVLPPSVTPEVLRVYNEEFTLPDIAYNARATVVGRVTAEKKYVLRHRGRIVMDVDIDFLTGSIRDELPFVDLPSHDIRDDDVVYPELTTDDIADILPRVLAHRAVCSREPLYRRYDAVVRGMTVVARGAGEAGVFAAVRGARLGVALAVAGNPRFGAVDPRRAAELAVVEAVCKVVATGARPLGLTDCLNFGNPRKIDQYSQFVAAVDGLGRAARELGLAFVSGNVSLYNESATGAAVAASPIVACVGALDDVGKTITPGLKRPGSALFTVGNVSLGFGGTVFAELLGNDDDNVPFVEYERLRGELDLIRRACAAGIIRSCSPIGVGGTLVAIAKAAFAARDAGRPLGVELTGEAAFDETPGFIVEVSDEARFLELAGDATVRRVGTVSQTDHFVIEDESLHVGDLYAVWSAPLAEVYP
ncbi:MAG: phosphoribosylformylglycinamidine synthase subunit PurL [Candidatus Eremiobacteraeota bacterium]|nr:phosphoribosylformylglycinamidine synthase subunit PurL [Candidatus Eremiobacteraeota bacterium]